MAPCKEERKAGEHGAQPLLNRKLEPQDLESLRLPPCRAGKTLLQDYWCAEGYVAMPTT